MCCALGVVVGCTCTLLLFVVILACCMMLFCSCRWKPVTLLFVVVGCWLWFVVILCGMLVWWSVVLEFDCWFVLPDVVVCCCLLSVCSVLLRVGVFRC